MKNQPPKQLSESLPSGTCDWCGCYKQNICGLCTACFRFPKPQQVVVVVVKETIEDNYDMPRRFE